MEAKTRWIEKKAEFAADRKRFFRFWGMGTGVVMGLFLLYWMWNDPPADPGAAAKAFLIVLGIAVAVPPVVWCAKAPAKEGN